MGGNLGAQLAKQGETSHLAIIAGKPGATGTWSIEKEKEITPDDVDEPMLYKVLTKYILTEEQLVDNGFPRPDPDREGMVLMKMEERNKPDPDKLKIVAGSDDKRLCCRCGAIYRVDKAGLKRRRRAVSTTGEGASGPEGQGRVTTPPGPIQHGPAARQKL